MIFASNWYWSVGGSQTQVWSSARAQFVPVTDAAYSAWLAAGHVATRILNAGELYEVLMAQWVPAVQATGVQVTSTANPALNGTYAIDAVAQAQLSALSTGIAAGKPLPGGGTTFNYPDMSRAMHAFSAADFLNFATAIEGFLYSFEQNLMALLNGQNAPLPAPSLTIP